VKRTPCHKYTETLTTLHHKQYEGLFRECEGKLGFLNDQMAKLDVESDIKINEKTRVMNEKYSSIKQNLDTLTSSTNNAIENIIGSDSVSPSVKRYVDQRVQTLWEGLGSYKSCVMQQFQDEQSLMHLNRQQIQQAWTSDIEEYN